MQSGKTTSISADAERSRPTIGFFATAIQHDWALWPWQGMVAAARENDVNLVSFIGRVVAWSHDFYEQANVVYALAETERLDGLAIWKSGLLTLLSDAEADEFCRRYDMPVVLMEGDVPGIPSITYDNYAGMQMVVEHLLDIHGYQRIGFLGLHEHHIGFQQRYQAYVDTLSAYGLPFDSQLVQRWIPPVEMSPVTRLRRTIGEWVQRAVAAGAGALIGACDMLAIHIIDLLREQGYRVPEDVAVVGFDDFLESRFLTPPLTTINPSWHEFGRQAVETLLTLLKGESVPDQRIIAPRLMVRQSCGCLDATVLRADIVPTGRKKRVHREVAAQSQVFIDELVQAVYQEAIETEHYYDEFRSLAEEFVADIIGSRTAAFVPALNHLLNRILTDDSNTTLWQNVISALREISLCWLTESEMIIRAETLWQQARLMIGQASERRNVSQRLRAERQAEDLRNMGQILITTFDVGELMNLLAERLPYLGIPGCYLAMFEAPQTYHYPDPPPLWSRLVLAYDRQGRTSLEPEGQRFPSRELCSSRVFSQEYAVNLVAEPLYFRDLPLGFLLFEVGEPQNGKIFETLSSLISSALHGDLLIQHIQRNAAELTRKNAELIRNQYILDTFMANVPDSIYFKDRDGRITKTNQAHARKFGYNNPSEEIGKTDFDMFPEEQARIKSAQEQQIMRTGQPLFDLEEPAVEGTWALTTKMPLRDEHGHIIGTFGISRDITALKYIQSELEHTNHALQESLDALTLTQKQLVESEKMAALGELVAGIAHEINTPLGVGVTAASYLDTQTDTIEQCFLQHKITRSDLRKYLQVARESSNIILRNLQRASESIKSFKQVAVDQTHEEKRTFKLKPYLDDVLTSLRPKIKQTSHHLVVTCPPDLELYSYPGAFSQIVSNFVLNSLIHGLENQPNGNIQIEITERDTQLWLRYQDNGKGMDQHTRDRIFDPFFTTKRGQGGTGLGLHVVYNLVTQKLGGQILCESSPNNGVLFLVSVPIEHVDPVKTS